MATVTVWRFDSADGAERATATFQDLAGDVAGLDAATVVWETGKGKPVARQVTTAADSLDSGFWGLLFGLIFFVPLLGAALGTATGALAGSLADVGIDDTFINRVRDQLTPGTSALVVVAADSIPDPLHDALTDGLTTEVISTDLSPQQGAALREVFAS